MTALRRAEHKEKKIRYVNNSSFVCRSLFVSFTLQL